MCAQVHSYLLSPDIDAMNNQGYLDEALYTDAFADTETVEEMCLHHY